MALKLGVSAWRQVSGAVNPANESTASFRECVLIRHPRHGEYALAFITGTTTLQVGIRTVQYLLFLLSNLQALQDRHQSTPKRQYRLPASEGLQCPTTIPG